MPARPARRNAARDLALFVAAVVVGTLLTRRSTGRGPPPRRRLPPVAGRQGKPGRDRPVPDPDRPDDWSLVDEAADESFPASDPPAY